MTDSVLPIGRPVNTEDIAELLSYLPLGSMVAPERLETPKDFAGRLDLAISTSEMSRTKVERDAGLGRGRIQRLLGLGSKPILSPGPEVIRRLADVLKVRYEWLAIGRGAMREADRDATPFEQAQRLVRWANVREDAIALAAERYADDRDDMNAVDWVRAIDDAARSLERKGVPRPEVVEALQRKTRRLATKNARQLAEIAALGNARRAPSAVTEPPTPRKRAPRTS